MNHLNGDPGWLDAFLAHARNRKWCNRIYCTTCGALDFRIGLLDAVDAHLGLPRRARGPNGRPEDGGYSSDQAVAVARGLARLSRPVDRPDDFLEDGVRMILHELNASMWPIEMAQAIAPLLQDSWPGEVLRAMQEHHAERVAERRAERAWNAPEAIAARRAEKKRLKAEAHAARLEVKKERDRDWWARNPRS